MAPKTEPLFNLKPQGTPVAPVDPDEIEDGSPVEEATQTDDGDDQSEHGTGADDFLSMIGNAATQEVAPLPKMDELTVLKDRARLMGISFSNNIGAEALAAKIKEKLEADRDQDKKNAALAADLVSNMEDDEDDGQDEEDLIQKEQEDHAAAVRAAKAQMGKPIRGQGMPLPGHLQNRSVRPTSVRQRLLLEAKKLVRCRITNMDPKKKDLHGEIITVANGVVGTVRKFIPFGESTENGFMMEQFIFNMLQKRKFLQVRVRMVKGREVVESKWVKEFALEILPLPTPEELAQLATAQLAAGSLEHQQ